MVNVTRVQAIPPKLIAFIQDIHSFKTLEGGIQYIEVVGVHAEDEEGRTGIFR